MEGIGAVRKKLAWQKKMLAGARERFSSWRVNGAATRKLPTLKFKFLLGFRPLYFKNTYAKQKKTS